jgi:hypothetical protein
MGLKCFHAFPGRSFCLSRRPPGRRLACFPPAFERRMPSQHEP